MAQTQGPYNLPPDLSDDEVWRILLADAKASATDGVPLFDVAFGCALLAFADRVRLFSHMTIGSVRFRPEYLKACVDDRYREGTARDVEPAELRNVRGRAAREAGYASWEAHLRGSVQCRWCGCTSVIERGAWVDHVVAEHLTVPMAVGIEQECWWEGCEVRTRWMGAHVAEHYGADWEAVRRNPKNRFYYFPDPEQEPLTLPDFETLFPPS